MVHLQEDSFLRSYEHVGLKRVEDNEINKLSINLESVHFISICCINILQCTVQKKIIKFNFTVQLIKHHLNTTNHSLPPPKNTNAILSILSNDNLVCDLPRI